MKITRDRLKDIIKEELSVINADAINAEQAGLRYGDALTKFEQDLNALMDAALDQGIPKEDLADVLGEFSRSV
mgnify:CR=1 FL=1